MVGGQAIPTLVRQRIYDVDCHCVLAARRKQGIPGTIIRESIHYMRHEAALCAAC